ncbi:transposase [Simkania sp.]|uniref:transposase n=1 Tax=Simkania sp. TaxID=34094 RepID=UPI003B518A1F
MVEIKHKRNHIHLFLSFSPSFLISEVVKTIKGRFTRKVFQKFHIIQLKFLKKMI